VIIVTGGAGFIGSAFIWKLNNEGIDDILIVDRLNTSEKWKNLVSRKFTDYIHKDAFLDILNGSQLSARAVVHMGACTSTTEEDADYLIENNYRYSRRLAEWSLDRGIPFIYASSAATYGTGEQGFSDDHSRLETLHPLNRYAYSKHLFDLWAYRNGLIDRMVGVKFFNVFGPNEYHKGPMASMVYQAFQQIQKSGGVKLFKSYHEEYRDGEQMRDFIYVKDCVEILWWFLQHPDIGGIYNVGTGRARTWNDLVTSLYRALGRDPSIEYSEMPGHLKKQYQYFTEAEMAKLHAAGCSHQFSSLEEAVSDYVLTYLTAGECCL